MKRYLPFIGICPLIYFILFGWLDWLPLRKYDEVRLAINAVEMFKNGNFIVTYFNGEPEMWNTKPPLFIWIQVLFVKLLGVNEVAIRLPSAIAAFVVCIVLYHISLKIFNSKMIGILSVLIIITSQGFVNLHGTRSGDYDSLLTLLMFSNSLFFFKYLFDKQNKYLILFCITLIMAVYTKSIAGLMFIPAYFIFSIYQRKLASLTSYKFIMIAIIIFLAIISYYILRERMNPGYINAVIENEITGRYLNTLEGHEFGFEFYLEHITKERFTPWFIFLFLGIFLIDTKDERQLSFYKFIILISASFLLIISFSQTKLIWYDMPIYPYLSILSANGIYQIFLIVKKRNLKLSIAFLVLLFIPFYKSMFSQCYVPRLYSYEVNEYKLCEYIRENKKRLKDHKNLNFLWKNYEPQNLFYFYMLKEENPYIRNNKPINKGDIIITQDENIAELIEKNYSFVDLNKQIKQPIFIYEILESKQSK